MSGRPPSEQHQPSEGPPTEQARDEQHQGEEPPSEQPQGGRPLSEGPATEQPQGGRAPSEGPPTEQPQGARPLREPPQGPRPKVSVIVPTLNEEAYLPGLLETLAAQTLPVHEVLVADAGSTDRTAELAEAAGARIVPGGHPGVGRNEGARRATGDWLLFLDADTRLPDDALETAFREMEREGLDAASCWFVPDSADRFLRLNHWFSSHYFRTTSRLGWPHSIGAFLLLPRALHEAIDGFDLSVKVAEDQDYVRRLAKVSHYGFLRRPVIEIAARRFDAEGALRQSAKWLGIELHRLILGEIRGEYFRYFK